MRLKNVRTRTKKLAGIYRQKSQNQTDKQVIEHIKNINDKTPLTDEEWHKLIFPCCNNGYIVKC